MEVFIYQLAQGITQTAAFAKKLLAQYAVNIGLKCGQLCTYCSTSCMLRTHPAFKQIGRSPFAQDYAIVDPDSAIRVRRDARRLRKRGLVQMCTIVDAWAPEAQKYNLGRLCLEAILSEPEWTVRILTKNASLANDFDIIERYRDRVTVGLSITAPPKHSRLTGIIEPYASPIEDRIAVLREAHRRGLRTYGMLCPLLPAIADAPEHIDELVKIATDCDAEEIFVEAVNPRGPGLKLTEQALMAKGCHKEAHAIDDIRNRTNWSLYVRQLIQNVQQSVRQHSNIEKLRFLLYPKSMTSEDVSIIRQYDAGVIWL